jgi:hypothetical protein
MHRVGNEVRNGRHDLPRSEDPPLATAAKVEWYLRECPGGAVGRESADLKTWPIDYLAFCSTLVGFAA